MRFAVPVAMSLAAALFAAPVLAQEKTKMVGGAPMYPSKSIVQNAVNSKDHTTLVTAVKAAGLVDTLAGPGPFTVFAPTNAAFAKPPAGTVETLVQPQSKATLASVLTYHIVLGRYTRVLGEHRYEVADPVVSGKPGEEGEADIHHALGL